MNQRGPQIGEGTEMLKNYCLSILLHCSNCCLDAIDCQVYLALPLPAPSQVCNCTTLDK